MVSAVLHCDIETYANELNQRSELLQRARRGHVGGAAVLRYLAGLRYLTENSARLFGVAAERAESNGERALAEHYRTKRGEESGHHVWAENDMRGVSEAFGGLRVDPRSPALEALIAWLEQEIEAAPVRYLAYALLAELVTVSVGPEWVGALEQHCGISSRNLSIVQKHVVLDREHVAEGLREIDRLAGPADLAGMRATIRTAIGHFDAFLSELLALEAAA